MPVHTATQIRGLALGAPYLTIDAGGGPTDTCDDLSTSSTRRIERSILKRGWGINNGPDALSAMSSLLDGVHSPSFDELVSIVLPVVGRSSAQQDQLVQSIAAQWGPERAQEGLEFIAALELPSIPPLPSSTYGWDLARMAMLARRTVAARWVDPNQVLAGLEIAAQRSREVFSNWTEFGVSFVVGRALWASDGEHYTSAESLALTLPHLHALLEDPLSPWVRLPW